MSCTGNAPLLVREITERSRGVKALLMEMDKLRNAADIDSPSAPPTAIPATQSLDNGLVGGARPFALLERGRVGKERDDLITCTPQQKQKRSYFDMSLALPHPVSDLHSVSKTPLSSTIEAGPQRSLVAGLPGSKRVCKPQLEQKDSWEGSCGPKFARRPMAYLAFCKPPPADGGTTRNDMNPREGAWSSLTNAHPPGLPSWYASYTPDCHS